MWVVFSHHMQSVKAGTNPQTSFFPILFQFSENPTGQGKVGGRHILCVSFSSSAVAGEELKIARVSVNLAQQPSTFRLGGGNHGFPAIYAESLPFYVQRR